MSAAPEPKNSRPSYHDLHITTPVLARTRILDLPSDIEVRCSRVTGWTVWRVDASKVPVDEHAELLGSEI